MRRARQLRWVTAPLVALCALGTPASAADQAIDAGPGLTFTPDAVTIAQGDSVTWTNAGGFHNVHFEDDSFVQPPFVSPDPWSVTRTFDTPGSFRYFCDVHRGAGMTGTVNVSARAADAEQAPAGTGASSQATPAAGGASARCVSQRRFRIRLRGLQRLTVRAARVELNGKQLPVRREPVDGVLRHTAMVDLRGLPRGAYTVAITVTTASGRVLRGTRTYRTCAAKLPSARLPRL
jgi:plastocyanin